MGGMGMMAGGAGGAEAGAALGMAGAAGVITVLKYVLITLGGGVLVGLFFGLVVAGIKYPNPNKKPLFTPLQKIIIMAIAVAGISMIIYAFTKKPGESTAVNAELPDGMGTTASLFLDENGMPMQLPSGAESTGEASGDGSAASSTEASGDSSESSSSESSSQSSAKSSTATASAQPKASHKHAAGAYSGKAIKVG
ncbi:MAG: hypothetical protein RSF33_07725 [Hydrogenoanaerobacterium sp.]